MISRDLTAACATAMIKDAAACNQRLALLNGEPSTDMAYVLNGLIGEIARLKGQMALMETRMRRIEGGRPRNVAIVPLPEVHVPDIVTATVEKVSAIHGVEPAELFASGRPRRVAWARFHAWHALKNSERALSYPWIARYFGFHHTSVIHGVWKWGEHGARYLAEELFLPDIAEQNGGKA